MKKHCLTCGEELKKRDHESANRYSKKKFCSSTHARVWLKSENKGWWNPAFDGFTDGTFKEKGVKK